jgi:hypothetical protein
LPSTGSRELLHLLHPRTALLDVLNGHCAIFCAIFCAILGDILVPASSPTASLRALLTSVLDNRHRTASVEK